MDAQANLNSAIISMEGLSTTIAANVTTSIDTLQELARDIAYEVKAVGEYRQSFNDMREKFRSGASTMLDTIQTEQRLATAELTLVDLRCFRRRRYILRRTKTASNGRTSHGKSPPNRVLRASWARAEAVRLEGMDHWCCGNFGIAETLNYIGDQMDLPAAN
jgi:hypothetical protein